MTDPTQDPQAARMAELERQLAEQSAAHPIPVDQIPPDVPKPAPVEDAVPAPAPDIAPAPVDPQAARIKELEQQLAQSELLAQQARRIQELEKLLAAAQVPMAVSDGTGNPTEPTHMQHLACGCSNPVTVAAATLHECEEHGLQPVSTYHEIPAE